MSEDFSNVLYELIQEVTERWSTFAEENLQLGPSANGFTGFLAMADEWQGGPQSVWHYLERPKTFTPDEFRKLWESFPEARKVEYVLSLISRK